MSLSHMNAPNTIDSLITELNCALATFDDSSSGLLSSQQKLFKSCCTVLRESSEKLARRSKTQRCVVVRAREVLANIYWTVSKEVFMLCAITISIARLNKLAPSIHLPAIRKWWSDQRAPQGLMDVTSALCDANAIEAAIASYQQAHRATCKISKSLISDM
jgi:hypothetical protein